ncbi:hypothetical protein DBB29_24750 [Pandoraea cepalis]|uniref:Uncharacterized protein n=1 Tax=Pandoraea cepalis TaxID=2508294 RepID=A0AAW7MGS3_9BURK|nr:hypothetical protein [Pandoraea cepalis]MDN4581325.1 hypothetical protein [Pandoraea cepalis]
MTYPLAILLCLIAYLIGHQTAAPPKNIVFAEKGAVLLEAALDRPNRTEQQLKAEIAEPIRSVLSRYQALGYVVIDASRNDEGDMTIAALPANALDITNELRAAVNLAPQQPIIQRAAASGALAGGERE